MFTYERIGALFWIGIGIAVTAASIQLGLGSPATPGPGFLPLGCGAGQIIFGSVILFRTFIITPEKREILWEKKTQWRKLIPILAYLASFSFLIEFLGFWLTALLFLVFMCSLEGMRWRTTIFLSLIATFVCYFLFQYLLGIRFPIGILKF